MRTGNLDFEYGVVLVVGKGGRERALPFGNRTGKALDQYLRARARHPMLRLQRNGASVADERAPATPTGGSRPATGSDASCGCWRCRGNRGLGRAVP